MNQQQAQMPHEGWMMDGQETLFHRASVPYLTMVVSSARLAFFTTYLVINTNPYLGAHHPYVATYLPSVRIPIATKE
jgi:hypothetical protein